MSYFELQLQVNSIMRSCVQFPKNNKYGVPTLNRIIIFANLSGCHLYIYTKNVLYLSTALCVICALCVTCVTLPYSHVLNFRTKVIAAFKFSTKESFLRTYPDVICIYTVSMKYLTIK